MRPPPADGTRYLIHLPLVAPDPITAGRVARAVARALSFHHHIAYDETTVSTEDDPAVRRPAFCSGRSPNGRRCLLGPDHGGPCLRRWR